MEGYFLFLLLIAAAFFAGYFFGKAAGINEAIKKFNKVFGPF